MGFNSGFKGLIHPHLRLSSTQSHIVAIFSQKCKGVSKPSLAHVGREKILPSCTEFPDWIRDLPSLSLNAYRGSLRGTNWPGREVNHSFLSSAEVIGISSIPLPPLHAIAARRGTNLPFTQGYLLQTKLHDFNTPVKFCKENKLQSF